MRPILVAALSAAVATGCYFSAEQSPTPFHDETLSVMAPDPGPPLKSGESRGYTLRLERGAGFRKEVRLTAKPPRGVEVVTAPVVVKPADAGAVAVTVRVHPDAPAGEGVVKLEATPDAGRAVVVDLRLTVIPTGTADGPAPRLHD